MVWPEMSNTDGDDNNDDDAKDTFWLHSLPVVKDQISQ